jgi:cell division protein FtsQ
MLLVDLDAARARLKALPWVADASVSRRLPDTLIVDVVERRPVALWQFHHRLSAIDRAGVPLTADRLERFATLPLVVGPEANRHVDELLTLLGGTPRLAAAVDAATFVGTRRWDLRFRSGETLALPEGAAAKVALARFDAVDRKTGLLGHGYTRFDLRQPGQMTVRVAAPVRPPGKHLTKPAAAPAAAPVAGPDTAVAI